MWRPVAGIAPLTRGVSHMDDVTTYRSIDEIIEMTDVEMRALSGVMGFVDTEDGGVSFYHLVILDLRSS
jgi:hypothetical protein